MVTFKLKCLEKLLRKNFLFWLLDISETELEDPVFGTNAWVCLMALISDFVIGYYVSFM